MFKNPCGAVLSRKTVVVDYQVVGNVWGQQDSISYVPCTLLIMSGNPVTGKSNTVPALNNTTR